MIEACARFGLLTQSMSVSGGDEDLIFSAHRLCSGRQMKRVQFMMEFDSIIMRGFYYNPREIH